MQTAPNGGPSGLGSGATALVRTVGLEPTHLAVLEPKSSASTNFARLARVGAYHAAVSGHTHNLSLLRSVIWLLVVACGGAPSQATAPQNAPEAKAPPAPAKAAEPAKPPPAKLAVLRDDVPLPLKKILGRSVADVQALLGEPLGKGMVRDSCVRFVPDRTFFGCKYALQRYADKTDNFKAVQVAFEEGVATEVAFDGWKHATGLFDPQALLTAIGLTLPEPGVESTPKPNVRLWRWFNHIARLVIDGKQYRVDLSVVDDEWSRSRVEIYLNDSLTPEQAAKIQQPAGNEPAPGDEPAKAP